jgi:hypothetical protein
VGASFDECLGVFEVSVDCLDGILDAMLLQKDVNDHEGQQRNEDLLVVSARPVLSP